MERACRNRCSSQPKTQEIVAPYAAVGSATSTLAATATRSADFLVGARMLARSRETYSYGNRSVRGPLGQGFSSMVDA